MFCPNCGKEIPDDVKFCGMCGVDLTLFSEEEEPNSHIPKENGRQQNDTFRGDGGQNPNHGKRRRNIIIIVIIAACAVVACAVFFLFYRSSQDEIVVEEDEARNAADEQAVARDSEANEPDTEANEPESEEPETEALAADEATADDTPEIPETAMAEENLAVSDNEISESTAPGDAVTATDTDTTNGAYEIHEMDVPTYDDLGELRVNATYDLIVLDGSDSAQQAINDGLYADMEKFIEAEQRIYDSSEIQSLNAQGKVAYVDVTAKIAYDDNGIFSVEFYQEDYVSGAVHGSNSSYGLTYSLQTGEEMSLSSLTGLDDAELLEDIKTGLKEWLASFDSELFSGAEEKIDALTLDDFGSGYTTGEGPSFIVEGGEIVLLMQQGYLGPWATGNLRIPSGIYISGMHYDFDVDYIIPDSSSRYLNTEDLEGLTKEELRIARNEIFARHNRSYQDEALNNYFSSKSWYTGTIPAEDFSYDVFNDYELKNLDLLNEYEREMGYQ